VAHLLRGLIERDHTPQLARCENRAAREAVPVSPGRPRCHLGHEARHLVLDLVVRLQPDIAGEDYFRRTRRAATFFSVSAICAEDPSRTKIGRSFLRHAGFAQTDEMGGFEQGADLRHPKIYDGLKAGDARIAIVAGQPAGLG
jgi:hypothetical protein